VKAATRPGSAGRSTVRSAWTTWGRRNVLAFQAFTGGYVKCEDVWLEPASHDNVMVGNSGTVIDEVVDNKVTGFAPVKGGVGAEVSEASQDVAQAEGMGFD
jgi:hypothetical protein